MDDTLRTFPHHKLEAWTQALELARCCKALRACLPRGHAALADQLNRASMSVALNLAEGANRGPGKAQRNSFGIARGECGEVAAIAELLLFLELVPEAEATAVLRRANRVGRLLTGLVRRAG